MKRATNQLVQEACHPKPRHVVPAVLLLLLIALLLPWAAQAQQRPPEARPQQSNLPEDVLLGLRFAVMLSETVGLVENDEWRERVSRIGYQVASASEDPDIPYSFDILDLPDPNAMALPGGFIFVTRGMMEIDLSDDELAHLLGHEITHVRNGHFQRAARVNSLLSIVQTALMIGILVGVPNDAVAGERIDRMDDPGLREWSVGVTGKDALVQGTALFGNVLQALYARSYSRKLEFEADDWGNRIAVRAGFSPAAGPAFLQRLHERSFEGQHFGYWRTHPYFDERLARAQARAVRLTPPAEPPDDSEYRERWALFFARAAEHFPGEKEAFCLYERALRCERSGLASLPGALEMARFKKRRESRKHVLLHRSGPLIESYDALIARAQQSDPEWEELSTARDERSALEQQRQQLLSDYLEVVDQEDSSTRFLEGFVENYPEHPRVAEMTYRLGSHYLLSDRAEAAVDLLEPVLRDRADTPPGSDPQSDTDTQSAWTDSARVTLLAAVSELDQLSTCYRLIREWGNPNAKDTANSHDVEIGAAAERRMEQLASADISLDRGGRFLQRYPATPWSERVRDKVYEQARKTFLDGRIHEGLHRYQDALDAYFSVLAFSGDSPIAEQAAEGIERINALETDATD